jgi:hypothetical protein
MSGDVDPGSFAACGVYLDSCRLNLVETAIVGGCGRGAGAGTPLNERV